MRPDLRILLLVELGAFFLFACCAYFYGEMFMLKYRDMRTGLFTGFLTMAGFTMTLKAFVMVNIAKMVHDSDSTRERLVAAEQYGDGGRGDMYGALERLHINLIVPTVLCLLGSVSQFTVGLNDTNPWAVGASLLMAVIAIISVAWAIGCMRYAIRAWIAQMQADAKAQARQTYEARVKSGDAS